MVLCINHAHKYSSQQATEDGFNMPTNWNTTLVHQYAYITIAFLFLTVRGSKLHQVIKTDNKISYNVV